ncbi:MAG: hypothetical protein K0R17_3127 [Rariglobus sp.]|jgi:hypothetical protein|nr:hypothetical protein [Rariglobus sp.]
MSRFASVLLFAASALSVVTVSAAPAASDPIVPLTVKGEDYLAPDGRLVRFWGVNLTASYPDHGRADAFARNLSELGVNLVRPHHLLRAGKDWNPTLPSGALLSYNGTSREFEPDALDRFDYLNAALRKRGIYLAFSTHFTRAYLPGDVDILKTDDADRAAWSAALAELNSWPSKKSFDLRKLLPVIDERAALLNEEFTRNLLTHVNPHTGLSYANDPQVISIEVVNEHALEYAIVCLNRVPDYWQQRLEQRWRDYAAAAGVEAGDFYKPAGAAIALRAKFLTDLDEAYFRRIQAVVRATGCSAPMTFSNLWRGDSTLEMHARTADIMENHAYVDPLVVRGIEDGLAKAGRTALAGKPFFIGELNQAEGEKNILVQSPHRTMLPVASAAYGAFNNWSGLVWFSWVHGEEVGTGGDGWARYERRTSNLGGMVADGMMIDHLRTTGIIFRRGLVAPGKAPVTVWTDAPFAVTGYQALMRGKTDHQPGWSNVHAMRRAYGAVPADQATAPWMTAPAVSPLVSDTGEIVKDVERRQFTVTAPQAEAFSGFPDDRAPAGLKHLVVDNAAFATVVAVAEDGKPFGQSGRLIISRTALGADGKEVDGPLVTLRGLAPVSEGQNRVFTVTRPRAKAGTVLPVAVSVDGSLTLPAQLWHEGELSVQTK